MYSMNNKSKDETVREFISRVNIENEVGEQAEDKAVEKVWTVAAMVVITTIAITVTVMDSLL